MPPTLVKKQRDFNYLALDLKSILLKMTTAVEQNWSLLHGARFSIESRIRPMLEGPLLRGEPI